MPTTAKQHSKQKHFQKCKFQNCLPRRRCHNFLWGAPHTLIVSESPPARCMKFVLVDCTIFFFIRSPRAIYTNTMICDVFVICGRSGGGGAPQWHNLSSLSSWQSCRQCVCVCVLGSCLHSNRNNFFFIFYYILFEQF